MVWLSGWPHALNAGSSRFNPLYLQVGGGNILLQTLESLDNTLTQSLTWYKAAFYDPMDRLRCRLSSGDSVHAGKGTPHPSPNVSIPKLEDWYESLPTLWIHCALSITTMLKRPQNWPRISSNISKRLPGWTKTSPAPSKQHTTALSQMMDILSSVPLVPSGIRVKLSFPTAFWAVLKVQWPLPVTWRSPLKPKTRGVSSTGVTSRARSYHCKDQNRLQGSGLNGKQWNPFHLDKRRNFLMVSLGR